MPLFTMFGIKFTWSLITKIGVALAIVGAGFFLYSKVKNHFDHIAKLERDNKDLQSDVKTLNDQKEVLIKTNANNARVYKEDADQKVNNQAVAAEERAAAEARKETYKEIRDAINSTPAADRKPVTPVVSHTIDSLWK